MALSTQQLLLLNNLMYLQSPSWVSQSGNPRTSYEGRTVGDLIEAINRDTVSTDFTSNSEWNAMIDAIQSDPQLMNVEIAQPYYDASTGDGGCLFVDPSTNEAVVTFRGTGHSEWHDNFIAGGEMDGSCISTQQQRAMDFVEGLDLSSYDTVTTTGHSKGGNKAKLCALMNGDVDRCVSFDGQGFSDEFMEKYADEIAANQHKIENHNADYDYVNLLLNDIGDTTFYEAHNVGDNFAKNHSPSVLFDDDCGMTPTERPEEMEALDEFLNSYLRSMDPKRKAESLDFAGEVAQAALGKGDPAENLKEVLFDPQYKDEAAYLLGYALQYEKETGEITNTLSGLFEEMGLGDFQNYVSIADKIIGNDFLYGLVKGILKLGDDIPDWLIDFVRDQFDIPLSNAEIRHLLSIIAMAGEYAEVIDVEPGSGEDITVNDSPSDGGSFISDILDNVRDWVADLISSLIFVNYAEMDSAIQEMNAAVEYYNDARRAAADAAEDLCSKWQGAARDAFYENQQRALQGYSMLSGIAANCLNAMKTIMSTYSDAERNISNRMRT